MFKNIKQERNYTRIILYAGINSLRVVKQTVSKPHVLAVVFMCIFFEAVALYPNVIFAIYAIKQTRLRHRKNAAYFGVIDFHAPKFFKTKQSRSYLLQWVHS